MPKTFKVKEVRTNRKHMGRGNRAGQCMNVETIASESGSTERWLPSSGDELNDLIEVMKPLSEEVTEYIDEAEEGKVHFFGDKYEDGVIKLIQADVDSPTTEESVDKLRSHVYSDSKGNLREEIKEYFGQVKIDMRQALKGNKFYSEENIEKNFGPIAREFISELKDYVDVTGPDPDKPDICGINRIIDLKRGLLETIDPYEWHESKEKKAYIKAEKNVYDAMQKYDYLLEKGMEDEAAAYKSTVADKAEALLAERAKYIKHCLGNSNKLVNNLNERLGDGRKRTFWGVKIENSEEYSKMQVALKDYAGLTGKILEGKCDINREELKNSMDTLRAETISYLKHVFKDDSENLQKVELWEKNSVDAPAITEDLIKNLRSTRSTEDGKNRVEAAARIINELNNNNELLGVGKMTEIDSSVREFANQNRIRLSAEESKAFFENDKIGNIGKNVEKQKDKSAGREL